MRRLKDRKYWIKVRTVRRRKARLFKLMSRTKEVIWNRV